MVPAVPPEPGLAGHATFVVSDDDTASAQHTGVVPALATPRLIALCEEACCAALEGALEEGRTSVGGRVQFDHLAPVAVGSEVTADAVLERIEGRRCTFTVTANDGAGLVGAGRITRVVVDLEAFLGKIR